MQFAGVLESFQTQIKEVEETLKEEGRKFNRQDFGWQLAAMFCEFLQSMFFLGFVAGVAFCVAIME